MAMISIVDMGRDCLNCDEKSKFWVLYVELIAHHCYYVLVTSKLPYTDHHYERKLRRTSVWGDATWTLFEIALR